MAILDSFWVFNPILSNFDYKLIATKPSYLRAFISMAEESTKVIILKRKKKINQGMRYKCDKSDEELTLDINIFYQWVMSEGLEQSDHFVLEVDE